MDDDRPLRERRREAARRLGVSLLLAVSPVGAPAIGWLLLPWCGIGWDEPFQCSLPAPVIEYFLILVIFSAGLFGRVFGILWLVLAVGILLYGLWTAARLAWLILFEREEVDSGTEQN